MENEVRENGLTAVRTEEAVPEEAVNGNGAAEDARETAVDGVSAVPVAVAPKAVEIPKQNPMQPLKTERIYSARVYCACYNGHSKNNIFCLGMEKRCECVQRFSRAPERTAFMEQHCVPGRIDQRCPLYEKLYELNA